MTRTSDSELPVDGHALERELDRLSLEQSLRDFEIANARVIDLTRRLVDLSNEAVALREQLVSTQAALVDARLENEAIRASATFKVGRILRAIRARVRV